MKGWISDHYMFLLITLKYLIKTNLVIYLCSLAFCIADWVWSLILIIASVCEVAGKWFVKTKSVIIFSFLSFQALYIVVVVFSMEHKTKATKGRKDGWMDNITRAWYSKSYMHFLAKTTKIYVVNSAVQGNIIYI